MPTRRKNKKLLLDRFEDMESFEFDELAFQLQAEELERVVYRDAQPHETGGFEAGGRPLDEHPQRNSSAEQPQLFEKLVREQQVWQDEEIARQMDLAGSGMDLSFTPDLENQEYSIYFAQCSDDRGYVGTGSVIKDAHDLVVFQQREVVGIGISHHSAEYTALINALIYAQSVGVRRVKAHGNQPFIYWEVKGKAQAWTYEQRQSIVALENQIKEFYSFDLNCVSRAENEVAITLANHALQHATGLIERISYSKGDTMECPICLEKIFPSDLVCQKECSHTFCYSCLSQHVETEISSGKVPVRCPQFGCLRSVPDNDCQRLVSPKLLEAYWNRLTEATISNLEKVYCPFPDCSALMCGTDKRVVNRSAASSSSSSLGTIRSVECMECHRLFCARCQVPWHADLTCRQYQDLPPDERDVGSRKLLQLLKTKKWKRCGNCQSPIILAEGCFHITCRCGNEFCYICGTNYRNKVKACRCPLFR